MKASASARSMASSRPPSEHGGSGSAASAGPGSSSRRMIRNGSPAAGDNGRSGASGGGSTGSRSSQRIGRLNLPSMGRNSSGGSTGSGNGGNGNSNAGPSDGSGAASAAATRGPPSITRTHPPRVRSSSGSGGGRKQSSSSSAAASFRSAASTPPSAATASAGSSSARFVSRAGRGGPSTGGGTASGSIPDLNLNSTRRVVGESSRVQSTQSMRSYRAAGGGGVGGGSVQSHSTSSAYSARTWAPSSSTSSGRSALSLSRQQQQQQQQQRQPSRPAPPQPPQQQQQQQQEQQQQPQPPRRTRDRVARAAAQNSPSSRALNRKTIRQSSSGGGGDDDTTEAVVGLTPEDVVVMETYTEPLRHDYTEPLRTEPLLHPSGPRRALSAASSGDLTVSTVSTSSLMSRTSRDSRRSLLSIDTSCTNFTGISGHSEVTDKVDNTFGQIVAKRVIAEVDRELLLDDDDDEEDDENENEDGRNNGGGGDNDEAMEQQMQQHNPEEDTEIGISEVFSPVAEEEDEEEEDGKDESSGGSGGNASRSSVGSLQSREELQRKLDDVHMAQQELKRREEELKNQVLLQTKLEEQEPTGTTSTRVSSTSHKSNGGGSSRRGQEDERSAHHRDDGRSRRRRSYSFGDDDASEVGGSNELRRRPSSMSDGPDPHSVGADRRMSEVGGRLLAKGEEAMREKDYITAKDSFGRLLCLYRSLPDVDKTVRANVHHSLGLAELEIGEYDTALVNLRTARRMRESLNDPVGAAQSLKECARLYSKTEKADDASRCFSKCLEMMTTELGDGNLQAVELCAELGTTARELGKEKRAIEQYEDALDFMKLQVSMNPDDITVCTTTCCLLDALGHLEFDASRMEDSLLHLEELVALSRTLDTSSGVDYAGALHTISKIHREMGRFDEAHEASKEALALSRDRRRELALQSHASGRDIRSIQSSQSSLSGILQLSAAASASKSEEQSSSAYSEQSTGYIPFVQVYDADHKKQIRRDSLRATMMKVYYIGRKARAEAVELLYDVAEMMAFLAKDAKLILSDPYSSEKQQEEVMENLLFDGCDLSVTMIDTYAPTVYGIQISDRLFWEAFVMPHDMEMYRAESPGNPLMRGFGKNSRRQSSPELQMKNLNALQQSVQNSHPLAAIPVVLQMDNESPMSPQTLVIAWEKDGTVQPATGLASDFHDRYSS